jgi:hypothetical protein
MLSRFQQIVKTFLNDRWRPVWSSDPALNGLESAMRDSLNSVAQLSLKKEELKNSGRFSNAGLTEETRLLARTSAVPALRKATEAVDAANADIERQRNALVVSAPDPLDMAGALLRSEMRAWLKSLPTAQAMQMLMDDNADERLVMAALETPPAMAGLTDQTRGMLQNHILMTKHCQELARLEQIKSAAEVVNAAVGTSLYQLRQEIDFAENQLAQFDEWMKAA